MDEYLAIIKMFAGNFNPRGFMFCQGQTMSISQNSALFSLLGTTYGGDGQTTFKLPDLQGRVPIGVGNGQGLSPRVLGQIGGSENTLITTNNLPSHTHGATFVGTVGGSGGGGTAITATLNAVNAAGTQALPSGNYLAGYNVLAKGIYETTGTLVPLAAGSITVSGGSSGGGITGGNVTIAPTGGSLPAATISPFLAVNYIICTEGVFPSRN